MIAADRFTPADAAIAREEFAERLAREEWLEWLEHAWGVRQQVFKRLCAHWFSAGPSPEEVLQRVFAAAADRRPDLLRGLSRREIDLAREESDRGRRWRLDALFAGRAGDWRTRYREVSQTLRVAFTDARRPEIPRVTLNEALSVGPDESEPEEATETLSRVLETIFRAGAEPRSVAQQAFALTGWLFRNLQLNMSLEALGRLFAEERATQSWRSKVYVEGLLRGAGFKGCKAGWQKPIAACESYRAAARGNQNRRRAARGFVVTSPTNKPTTNESNAIPTLDTTKPRPTASLRAEVAA